MVDSIESLLSKTTPFRDKVYRNIKSLRVSEDLFDDLSDDPRERGIAMAVESATRAPTARPSIARPFDDVIDYPFANFSETRFSDGSFGVFYGSLALDTTIYETIYHWYRFLQDSGFETEAAVSERRVHVVKVDAVLFDCRESYVEYPGLIDPENYQYTHTVGRYIKDQQRDGLLTKSARCDGINTPIFRQDRLNDPIINCYLTYRLDPTADVVNVEKQIGKRHLQVGLPT
ncbi:MAG: RES family NAD+ phosphorylase [Pseudomonadota bacterium]